MLVAVPVGQTDDVNFPGGNEVSIGGENATEWEGIDPGGIHATAEAKAWAGPVPEASMTPTHLDYRRVPLMKLGERTVWKGTCTLRVRRWVYSFGLEEEEKKEKPNQPLRIEVRRVRDTVKAALAGAISVFLVVGTDIDLPVLEQGIEAAIDLGMAAGGAVSFFIAAVIMTNEINTTGVDEDGNPAYQDAELWHDSAEGLTIIHSDGYASAIFAGDSNSASRISHTHDGLGLHPER